MFAHAVNPILNVSSFQDSVEWFEKIGFRKVWEWGENPGFGGVKSGNVEIFLCQGAQGGRGKSPVKMTFGPDGDQTADKGVWLSLWVDDVDQVHAECVSTGLDSAWPPTNMPWGVREMHLRHPAGHVFRIGTSTSSEEEE